MLSSRILNSGLAALALIGLAATTPAHAGANNYNYSVTFNTPASYIGTGNGDIRFLFTPDGPDPANAYLTAGSLSYSSGWKIDPFGITEVGDAGIDYFAQTVTLGNTQAQNGFSIPVTKWGAYASLSFNYTDPPGTDPTDFTLTLQQDGLPDASLFDVRFDPSGTATLMSSASGVTITSQAGTPALDNPVPEASTTVSFGLLLALGLGGLVVASKRRKATAPRSH
jgi:hypothetical protein